MDKIEIQIIVATHKPFPMPGDEMYLPLSVGAAERESAEAVQGVTSGEPGGDMPDRISSVFGRNTLAGTSSVFGGNAPGSALGGLRRFIPDNTGDNISDQNHIYSELTGLYWAWKNLDADYIGLVHYRRYFKEPRSGRGKHPEAPTVWKMGSGDARQMLQRIPYPVWQQELRGNLQSMWRQELREKPLSMQQEHLQPVSPGNSRLNHQRSAQDMAMEISSEAFQWQDIADAGRSGYDLLNKNGFYTEGFLKEIQDANNIRNVNNIQNASNILQKSCEMNYPRQLAKVLTYDSLQPMLAETDIILPRRRNYHIETLYSHYAHTHCAEHLDVTREIIAKRCPEYVPAFDEIMQRTGAHMFNMMIMQRDRLDEYCSWLFPILRELVERIDASGYDDYQARFPGRVSELMLDVWLAKRGYCYQELPMMMIGPKHWGRKILSFLGAKFLGRRYRESY